MLLKLILLIFYKMTNFRKLSNNYKKCKKVKSQPRSVYWRTPHFLVDAPPVGGPGLAGKWNLLKASTKGTYLPPPGGGSRYVTKFG